MQHDNMDDAIMKMITSKTISHTVKELLSYATFEKNFEKVYENYIKTANRSLYGFEYRGKMVGCIRIKSLGQQKAEITHIALVPW